MKMAPFAFGTTDWSAIEPTEHTGETGMANGFTVGKVHVGGRSGGSASGQASMLIAPAAMAYLEQTGLLASHVDVADWGWP